jgi:hypothetical protein
LQGIMSATSTLTHVVITGRARPQRRSYPLISSVNSF